MNFNELTYKKAIELLYAASSSIGFFASIHNAANYQRVWARDGVIIGLAALASGEKDLIKVFEKTLNTLAKNQHEIGTIPSNISINKDISYGGLAGRVDANTWYIIGVCQYALQTNNIDFFKKHKPNLIKCLNLLNAWEFNNNHLLYVPLSGNWADEYIVEGYVLYDQILRLWGLNLFNKIDFSEEIHHKIINIQQQLIVNYAQTISENAIHPKAKNKLILNNHLPCSFSPSGYKTNFDAFAHGLIMMLSIEGFNHTKYVDYILKLIEKLPLKLVPAFWPPILEDGENWNLLKDNCKYEFRNYPFEFHNGGSWPMVNGFIGIGLIKQRKRDEAEILLKKINEANNIENFGFYENFNSENQNPNGIKHCVWSAAATILLNQTLYSNFKLIT